MEVRILEEECIGCGACVPVCSTGAITFDDDEMKAVVARDECVGCEDCIPMCAVDAIVPEALEGEEGAARPASGARPEVRSAASRDPGASDRATPGGPGLPGGPTLPGSDAHPGSCDSERFDLGSWRPGKGSLRRALKRRLGLGR